MRRVVLVVGIAGLVMASANAGCESDGPVAGPQTYGGTTGSGGQDAGDSGTGGSWPTIDGGASGGTAGGWPDGGTGGTGGAGGAATGGAAGTGAGGTGGTETGGAAGSGTGGDSCGVGQGGSGGPCEFPQGVPDPDFICAASAYGDTDPAVDADVNAVMATLSGCGVMSDCDLTGFAGTTPEEICQSWFAAVTQALRDLGYCAGQHQVGGTDEIAVSNTGCTGKWYGYHVCYYGGPKVVWNPGARRGWWMIEPSYCPP